MPGADGRLLDPIVVVRELPDGGLDSSFSRVVPVDFSAKWYTPFAEYAVYGINGELEGSIFHPQPVDGRDCNGLGTTARASTPFDSGFAGFASSRRLQSSETHILLISATDSHLLRRAALAVVPDSIPDDLRQRLIPERLLHLQLANSTRWLAGAYRATEPEPSDRLFSVFVLLADREPVLHLAVDGVEPDFEVVRLEGFLDLDGDRIPELILNHAYYESWAYSIRSLRDGKWRIIYQGGGAGC